jgi:hypothetical protein
MGSGKPCRALPARAIFAGRVAPAFSRFFGVNTLSRIRLIRVPQIPNPPFYTLLAAPGIPVPIDFAQMAGITFLDTVLISQRKADFSDAGLTSLLFHEAIHVVQYEHLGLDAFMQEYVMGWAANGFEYRYIPLEQQAYALQDRFVENPSAVFCVHDEVRRPIST